MTIDKVTSLADLEFKAKTNKYYQQLAILGAKRCCGSMYEARHIDTYEKAIHYLQTQSVKHNPNSCSAHVEEVNRCCNKIVEEVIAPTPPVEAATPPSGEPLSPVAASVETLRAIVAEAKKKSYEKWPEESSPWNELWTTLANPYAADPRPFNEALERERQEFARRQRLIDEEDRQLYRNRPSYRYNQYYDYYSSNTCYDSYITSDPE